MPGLREGPDITDTAAAERDMLLDIRQRLRAPDLAPSVRGRLENQLADVTDRVRDIFGTERTMNALAKASAKDLGVGSSFGQKPKLTKSQHAIAKRLGAYRGRSEDGLSQYSTDRGANAAEKVQAAARGISPADVAAGAFPRADRFRAQGSLKKFQRDSDIGGRGAALARAKKKQADSGPGRKRRREAEKKRRKGA